MHAIRFWCSAVLCMVIGVPGAVLLAPAGATDMCGGCGPGNVCINCGSGPQCAEAPAVCSGGKICGGGMIGVQTAHGPDCGVPKVTRCGIYTCGENMVCVNTAQGPQCGLPPPDALGRVWNESELGWTGTWTRQGSSNQFSANWTHPSGRREAATLTITIRGRNVSILRSQQGRGTCQYTGVITGSGSGRSVQGTYGCAWAPGPFPWNATIQN
jgi:hypothetical protein